MLAAALLPVLAGGWWVWGGLTELGRQVGSGFGLLLVGAALFGAALAALLAHRLGKELFHMANAAEALGRGELAARMPVPDSHELGGLARTFNDMAGQLQQSIGAITQKQDELETVLAHMREAVLVVDDQERIINFNRSAARMFYLRPEVARGRYLVEMVRNAALIRFVADTLKATEPVNRQITLQDGARDLALDAHGTLLRDAAGTNIGALVVLHDLTMASRFCDRITVLDKGQIHATGKASKVLTAKVLKAVYGITAYRGEADGVPFVVPLKAIESSAPGKRN